MKLSELKISSIVKKMKFVNGEIIETNSVNELNGEINFYNLDVDRLSLINEKLVKKIEEENVSDEEFMFRMLPYLCDVECDITFDEFHSLMESPSKPFAEFIRVLLDSLNGVYDMLNSMMKVSESAEETNEKVLEDLYEKLKVTEDKELKKQIIKQISKMQGE